MRFTARMQYQDANEHGPSLNSLATLMRDKDGTRLFGDLFRHSANTGWTIHVGTPRFRDYAELLKRFWSSSEMGQDVTFEFPVTLESENGRDGLVGGLIVRISAAQGEMPHYVGYSIHT
jgi:hypothetical protein